jgi:secretion/DNA translocation related TadE-like protein
VTAAQGAAGGLGPPRHLAAGSEQGGASLVAMALAGFLLLAGLLAVDVGALVAARAAAQTAADMAALAALTPSGGAPPARAAAIASANGAELAGCDCSTVEAVVTVRRRVALVPTGLSVRVTARARAVLAAGPPTTGGQQGAGLHRRDRAGPAARVWPVRDVEGALT